MSGLRGASPAPGESAGSGGAPLFRVVSGHPDAEELAAVTAVLLAAAGPRNEGESANEASAMSRPSRRERIRKAVLRPQQAINQRRGRL